MRGETAIAQGRAACIARLQAVRACRSLTYCMWASLAALPSQAQPLQLPPVQVQAPSSCVDVQVQGARSISFDCLNQQLKADAQQGDTPPTVTAKDVTGNGAPTTVGTFSYTGTSIRMGNAFGHSAIPQRPAPPSLTNVLLPAGGK